MQKVVISILHYKSSEDTISCLKSLLDVRPDDYSIETYVLDNASKEKLKVDPSNYKAINLHLLESPVNLGFTGGHNLVYSTVAKDNDFDFFLLLNNDSLVEKDFLSTMIKVMKDENVGAAVPKIYFTKGREFHKERYEEKDKGRVIWYAGGKMDWGNVMSIHMGVDEVDRGQFDKLNEIEFATGACLLLRKPLLDEIGLFDKRYFLYFEDADLSMRIIKKGKRIVYQPDSIVWHNNAGSSGSGSELHDYYLTRNRMLFGIRHAPLRTKVALIRESFRLLSTGRKWQKIGIRDYYLKKFGKGSYIAKG